MNILKMIFLEVQTLMRCILLSDRLKLICHHKFFQTNEPKV